MLIDSHAHLSLGRFDGDREAALARANAAGVKAIVDVGIDMDSGREVLRLAQRFPQLHPSLGFHPHYADRFDSSEFWALWDQGQGRAVALGEIGLDYYRNLSTRENQKAVFETLAARARELKVPVIIHLRDAMKDGLDILGGIASGRWVGVMHCFSGDIKDMEAAIGLGFHISVAGMVTYPGAEKLAEVVKSCPADRLLVETDAPFLAPQSERGKRNEPEFITHTVRKIAEIRGVDYKEAAELTAANARKLFGIKEIE